VLDIQNQWLEDGSVEYGNSLPGSADQISLSKSYLPSLVSLADPLPCLLLFSLLYCIIASLVPLNLTTLFWAGLKLIMAVTLSLAHLFSTCIRILLRPLVLVFNCRPSLQPSQLNTSFCTEELPLSSYTTDQHSLTPAIFTTQCSCSLPLDSATLQPEPSCACCGFSLCRSSPSLSLLDSTPSRSSLIYHHYPHCHSSQHIRRSVLVLQVLLIMVAFVSTVDSQDLSQISVPLQFYWWQFNEKLKLNRYTFDQFVVLSQVAFNNLPADLKMFKTVSGPHYAKWPTFTSLPPSCMTVVETISSQANCSLPYYCGSVVIKSFSSGYFSKQHLCYGTGVSVTPRKVISTPHEYGFRPYYLITSLCENFSFYNCPHCPCLFSKIHDPKRPNIDILFAYFPKYKDQNPIWLPSFLTNYIVQIADNKRRYTFAPSVKSENVWYSFASLLPQDAYIKSAGRNVSFKPYSHVSTMWLYNVPTSCLTTMRTIISRHSDLRYKISYPTSATSCSNGAVNTSDFCFAPYIDENFIPGTVAYSSSYWSSTIVSLFNIALTWIVEIIFYVFSFVTDQLSSTLGTLNIRYYLFEYSVLISILSYYFGIVPSIVGFVMTIAWYGIHRPMPDYPIVDIYND